MAPPPRLRSTLLGERAVRFELTAPAPVLARAAAALAEGDATLDAAAGSTSIVVVASAPIDPLRRAEIGGSLASALASARAGAGERRHEVDVAYDGPDLDALAEASGMTAEAFATAHAERDYVVELKGFLPGFAYLGDVPERLRAARRPQPRARVAAGSVGIAGRQTGIYPTASPGGWNLVGRARLAPPLFDPAARPPARFDVGDRVRFRPVPPRDVPEAAAPLEGVQRGAGDVVVDRVAAVATVQDGGRARWLHLGVPAAGALDPVALAAANLAVGNDPSAAGIEVAMGSARLLAGRDLLVSIDGAPARRILPGDALDVASGPRLATYVAVRGGLAVPEVLGARGTALAASLGGLHGRALRRGDTLPIGEDPGTPLPDRARLVAPGVTPETVLRVDLSPKGGPIEAASIEALLAAELEVSTRLDRVGVRLEGAAIPHAHERDARPEPVIPGVVQLAADGTPMVLGPDAAVTGGYPVIGVLRRTSLWALYRLRPGARVRFARPAG